MSSVAKSCMVSKFPCSLAPLESSRVNILMAMLAYLAQFENNSNNFLVFLSRPFAETREFL